MLVISDYRPRTRILPSTATLKTEAPLYPLDENGNIKMLVPGYGKEDFSIELKEDVLHIQSSDEKIKGTFELLKVNEIDTKKITATCEKGILIIQLPRKKPKVTSIKIL